VQQIAKPRQRDALDRAQIEHEGAQVLPALRQAQGAILAPAPPGPRP
jgi:hypothetical protein